MRLSHVLPLAFLLPLLACGAEPLTCPEGQVVADGQCMTPEPCEPGALRCDDPRTASQCNPDGTGWLVADQCEGDYLCQAGECLGKWVCEVEEPPCCLDLTDCGAVLTPSGCPECRPISRESWCDATACVDHTGDLVGFTLVADMRGLPSATASALRSMVGTIYQPYLADGSTVDCSRLLADTDGPSLHDAKAPELNPVFSSSFQVDTSGGTTQASLPFGAVPAQSGLVLVLTGYDHASGSGTALARSCLDGVTVSDGSSFLLELAPR